MTNERSIANQPFSFVDAVDNSLANGPTSPVRTPVRTPVGTPIGAPVGTPIRDPGIVQSTRSARPVAPLQQRPSATVLRRRRVAVIFGVGVLTLTGVGVASASVGHSTGSSDASTIVHIVMPGESLWSIAREAKPNGDVRPLVAKLRRQLGGAMLQPGDEVVVPAA